MLSNPEPQTVCWSAHARATACADGGLQCTRAKDHSVLQLGCPDGMTIAKVAYASYGLVPDSEAGACHDGVLNASRSSQEAVDVVESLCTERQACSVYVSDLMFPTLDGKCPLLESCSDIYATAQVECQIASDFQVDPNFHAWSKHKYVPGAVLFPFTCFSCLF